MAATRITGSMRRSLQSRLEELDARIETLDAEREGNDSVEATALLVQLRNERSDVSDALRDARVIDSDPFDTEAIEIGDTVTIRDPAGDTDRYVLVDGKVGSRARSDWVSISSPLGATLLGRSKGDRVRVDSPRGAMTYVILAFERATDDALVPRSGEERLGRQRGLLPSEAFVG